VQRHLPTGGVEIHFPIGGHPQLVGPLTGPEVEVIPAHTTIVGVRFHPGTAPPLPTVLDDLVDQRLGLAELWRSSADRLAEAMAGAGAPERALMFLRAHLVQEFRGAVRVDPLVGEAVKALMPWHPVNIDTLATHLALSASQLRRRCLHAVGVSPKVLQRTLRQVRCSTHPRHRLRAGLRRRHGGRRLRRVARRQPPLKEHHTIDPVPLWIGLAQSTQPAALLRMSW
jgi:AraC-like DNA-binding protein